jgi:hypothetical protein
MMPPVVGPATVCGAVPRIASAIFWQTVVVCAGHWSRLNFSRYRSECRPELSWK